MTTSSIRLLLVDDYEAWHNFFLKALREKPELQIMERVFDGLHAVQKAQELQPDLILLDIGLPTLNGIEAARRIREVAPSSKILFVSENRSSDIVMAALGTGANGYLLKSDAGTELLPAVEAVLQGRQFVSRSLAGLDFGDLSKRNGNIALPQPPGSEATGEHMVGFYSNNQQLIDDVSQFVGRALKAGNATVVIATELHRDSLLSRLQTDFVDVDAAIEQGRYIALDAAETLSAFMVGDSPDPVRLQEVLGDPIVAATKAAKGQPPRVSIFVECVSLLWAQGNLRAAIELEKLANGLVKIHSVDILCGYCLSSVEGGMDEDMFQGVCAEHSRVYSR